MYKIAVIIAVVIISVNTASALPGSGTEADPWRIESLADFNEFAADANYWDDYTRLETDVNLAGQTYTTAVIAPDTNSLKSAFQGTAFTGVFDGNGCKIIGLTVDDGGAGNDYLGLFGYIKDSQVRNLGLERGCVSGNGWWVGGLVGNNWDGIVSNCYSTGDVSGSSRVGGLVGGNGQARNAGGTITNCYSSSDVSGVSRVGGLVGYHRRGIVSNCYSTGETSGHGSIGGLVGENDWGIVWDCYSSGETSGGGNVGGLVGYDDGGVVRECYSAGDVSGVDHVGGLVGWALRSSVVSNCFWDTDTQTHGVTESIGYKQGTVTNVAGLPTVQMQTMSTFTSGGWDFVGESANGTSETWQMPADGVYPVLSFFHGEIPFRLTGSGTVSDPYLIGNTNELGMVNWHPVGCCFKLTGDINLSEIHWSGPVVPVFSGCLDGHGHKLVNLEVSGVSYVGLVGYLGKGGQVSNLGLERGSFSGDYHVGGLVGENWGSVSNCYSTANVTGHSCVGGLVGFNHEGSISNSYSASETRADGFVGGIVGRNHAGSVWNCYSAGETSSNGCVGGLVGENDDGSVANCYSIGGVRGGVCVGGLVGRNHAGSVWNCYSAGDTSGDEDVGGLVGEIYGGSVSNCYSRGETKGDRCVGGLVGRNERTISNCYSTGDISAGVYVGGLVGYNPAYASVSNCFWDIDTQTHGVTLSFGLNSGDANNVAGLSTAQMQTQSTFTSAGWDFVGETANGTEDIWTIHETVDYPKFVWKLVNFTGRHEVDLVDFAFFAGRWMDANCGDADDCDGTDVDLSGTVDAGDLAILCGHWLEGAGQ